MTNFIKYNFIILIAALFSSCATSKQPTANHKTMVIGAQQVDCTGVGPQKCYQVKEGDATEWSNFYGAIEGFDYNEGTEYVVEVAVSNVENPPADASSLKYKLVKILKETEKPFVKINGTWVISTLNGEVTDPMKTYIIFDTNKNSIFGFAGCNGLNGQMEYDEEKNTYKGGPFMSTMMFCEEVAENERALGKILEKFNKIAVEGDVITISLDDEVLLTAKKGVNHQKIYKNWKVSFINGVDDLGETAPSIFINNRGEVNGNGGCNNFKGAIQLDAFSNNVKIGPLAATRMMCPNGDVESTFFAQIDKVDNYKIENGELQLFAGDQLVIKAKK
ncbi:META domain-containing protein [Flammeovirga kamogawensis]|uniref:META domain-containing protein n=1 Tax=Flammeovirga kamogawensis TaxID=373891 RepID=A0ABX8GZ96_9BACT|nr:META domain-containing protein [Flammeovirga kamogawensis]MBB6459148.1 heat shock protein HslJ [Flammeovirga kamogawensis]QWG08714.1 META domain-containing protein [Flammeovirga kamogawensis]TRX67007.1 META domain-containing protein [Flammeovirga kamogawensis]